MPTQDDANGRATTRRHARSTLLALSALAGIVGMTGCEIDGWLGDPSVLGRWEHTPTVVPILERIDVIEADTGEFVDVTQVMPDDLVPQVSEYVLGPGDFVRITIFDLLTPGVPYVAEITVNENGMVDIPEVGRVNLSGRTSFQVRQIIAQRLLDSDTFNTEPIVDVQALSRQEATYSVFGAVQNPGRFGIPRPDHRLLEALTNAGGISPVISEVFVIRQVPLSDAVSGVTPPDDMPPTQNEPLRPVAPDNENTDTKSLIDLFDQLNNEKEPAGAPDGGALLSPGTNPGVLRTQDGLSDGSTPTIDLDDALEPPSMNTGPAETIDITDPVPQLLEQGDWRFINGRWVRVMPMDPQSVQQLPEGDDPLDGEIDAGDLVTQRVIGVPTGPLLQGVARFNIVIRPGDIIHIPAPETGLVYAAGPGIARAGVYNIPGNGRLTMLRLIATAGGLSAVSVPERVDLTRMVGDDRQATIRLNARAIAEGTHPDIFLKPDDLVNFGTDFWSVPFAVIRNGFRFSYGFGFLLDRNFGNDVFGAPPSNNRFGP